MWNELISARVVLMLLQTTLACLDHNANCQSVVILMLIYWAISFCQTQVRTQSSSSALTDLLIELLADRTMHEEQLFGMRDRIIIALGRHPFI